MIYNVILTIKQMSTADQSTFLSCVDALVTDLPEVCIAVTTADCVPIVFFDERKKVIGVAHADIVS